MNRNLKVTEYLEFWIEEDIRKNVDSYNTYSAYRGIVKNHILPFLGKKKLVDITKADTQRLYNNRMKYSENIAKQLKVVLTRAFLYAQEHKLIVENPITNVKLPKKQGEKGSYHTRSIDATKTLTKEQIDLLLEESKESKIHMQILFNVMMGLRRSEINGLKYTDIDYINRTLRVDRQLGKKLLKDKAEQSQKATTKDEIPPKTKSSIRELPIPDIVFEAILVERKKYEKNRNRRINDKHNPFFDRNFICCSTYGKPRGKDFHYKHYKNLLEKLGLPNIRWHDLRGTYATLLLKEGFSLKAVSKLLGHSKEIITMDVYGDNVNIIPEQIPELLEYMEEVLSPREADTSCELLKINLDLSEYFAGN